MRATAREEGKESDGVDIYSEDQQLLIGGKYELHQTLGVGVQGSVRAATDVHSGEVVAIKLIPKEPFVCSWLSNVSGRSRASAKVTRLMQSDVSLSDVDEHHPAMEPIAREVAILESLRGHPNVVELKNVIWNAMLYDKQTDVGLDTDGACNDVLGCYTSSGTTDADSGKARTAGTPNHSVFRDAHQAVASTAAWSEQCSSRTINSSGAEERSQDRKAKQQSSDTAGTHVVAVVMELCSAGELFDLMFYGGAFSEDLAFPLFAQLLSALQYSHHSGVCHRDIKPENILFDKTMRLRVADFGLAGVFRNADLSSSGTSGSFGFSSEVVGREPVQDGKFNLLTWSVGTSYYMAPEVLAQRRHGHVDGRDPLHAPKEARDGRDSELCQEEVDRADDAYRNMSVDECRQQGRYPFGYVEAADVWSAGVVLFLMLVGSPPFHVADCTDWWFNELYHGRVRRFWRAHLRTASLSRTAINILTRMLDPRPEERPTVDQLCTHPFIRNLFIRDTGGHGLDGADDTDWFIVSEDVMLHVREGLLARREEAISIKNEKLKKQRKTHPFTSSEDIFDLTDGDDETTDEEQREKEEEEEEEMSKEIADKTVHCMSLRHHYNEDHDGSQLSGQVVREQVHELMFAHRDVDGGEHVRVMSMSMLGIPNNTFVHPSQLKIGSDGDDIHKGKCERRRKSTTKKDNDDEREQATKCQDQDQAEEVREDEDEDEEEEEDHDNAAAKVEKDIAECNEDIRDEVLPNRNVFEWEHLKMVDTSTIFGLAQSIDDADEVLAQTLSILAPSQWQRQTTTTTTATTSTSTSTSTSSSAAATAKEFRATVSWKSGTKVQLSISVARHRSRINRCAMAIKRIGGDAIAFQDVVDTITTAPTSSFSHSQYVLATVVDSVL